jgi:hypothetical protein
MLTVKYGGGSLILMVIFGFHLSWGTVNGIMNFIQYKSIFSKKHVCLCLEAETWPQVDLPTR